MMTEKCVALLLAIMISVVTLTGCSSESDEPPEDHVFKGYEQAMERAQQIQPQLEDAEAKRRKQLEEATR